MCRRKPLFIVTSNDEKEIELNNLNLNVIKYCPQNHLNSLLKIASIFHK
jgi:hypothetical protein